LNVEAANLSLYGDYNSIVMAE